MAVRVKLKVNSGITEKTLTALVNTGFESETPDLLLPVTIAEELGIWPPTSSIMLDEYSTVSGSISLATLPKAVKVQAVSGDKASREVTCNVVVSPQESEVLISDMLAEELGIVILKAGRGYWRFIDDPQNVVRISEPP
ncbi:MAG: hypothetical protein ACTSWP_04020 [Candidatus Freyarchaeota archaeon]|mgnify:CR=1 FL=1|nr:hypothetical protein [Candidatus Freyrarchaeum guaymaensis]